MDFILYSLPVLCFLAGLGFIYMGDIGLGLISILLSLGIVAFYIHLHIDSKKRDKLKEAQAIEKAKKQERLYQSIQSGDWNFPSEKFYQLCSDNHVTILDNEFSIKKATQLAEGLIKEAEPTIDLGYFSEYLKKDNLEGFLKKGEILVTEAEERRLLAQKEPKSVKPTASENTFIRRTSELLKLFGSEKRIKMLTNLISDYDAQIKAKLEGEEALKQLGMIFAQQQQKETSWAVIGGIAEGIAGPAAGIMAAQNTMANNLKIQEHNAAVRKASMDIMSGIPSVAADRYELEKERKNINQKLNEAKNKVVLSAPDAAKIWQNIKVGKTTVKKNPSGVLTASVSVSAKKPFALDVPEDAYMVIDGVLFGQVWFEDKFVDNIYFPFPLYGISTDEMTEEITLDGMCGRSVEYNGEYTVKLAETQNVWIMEE